MNENLSSTPFLTPDVSSNLFHMEQEITFHRNQLLIADQYAKLAAVKNAALMPPLVQQWLEYRISVLIAQQTALLAGNPPPTIVT